MPPATLGVPGAWGGPHRATGDVAYGGLLELLLFLLSLLRELLLGGHTLHIPGVSFGMAVGTTADGRGQVISREWISVLLLEVVRTEFATFGFSRMAAIHASV